MSRILARKGSVQIEDEESGGGPEHARSASRETMLQTIDPLFILTEAQLTDPRSGVDATHMYNGKPTDFTNLQRETVQTDARSRLLPRSNFLAFDGVLYEINDCAIEQEALWSHGWKTHLTYNEYCREMANEKKSAFKQLVTMKRSVSNMTTYNYNISPHAALGAFYPSLVSKSSIKVQLCIPTTMCISEYGEREIYYTCPKSGCIEKIPADKVDDRLVSRMFGLEEKPDPTKEGIPIAILKKPVAGYNDVKIMSHNTFWKELREQTKVCVQVFVRPRGRHASLYRSTWRRHDASNTVLISGLKSFAQAPSLSSGEDGAHYFCTNSRDLESNSHLSFRGKAAAETESILHRLVCHLEKYGPPCRFDEFVGDFIRDASGRCVFIQAKGFVCRKTDGRG